MLSEHRRASVTEHFYRRSVFSTCDTSERREKVLHVENFSHRAVFSRCDTFER